MSSIFSIGSKNAKQSTRRRSASVSAASRAPREERSSNIDFNEINDVSTHVCTETAKAILLNPDVRTGNIFKTIDRSQRDINKSDTTIIMTAAILGHVENTKMEQKILERSHTCRRLYKSLNLDNPEIRSLFVTMMFSLNPNFATMVNSSLKVAIDRIGKEVSSDYSENQLLNSMKQLSMSNALKGDEIRSMASDTVLHVPDSPPRPALSSIQTTPTDKIGPDDSVSVVARNPSYRRKMDEGDIREFLKRKKSGAEPSFEEVFPSAKPPISMMNKRNRRGLGFASGNVDPALSPEERVSGRRSVDSVNIMSGKINKRVPRVEDTNHYEVMSQTATREVPEAKGVKWDEFDFRNTPRAPRTESFLPESATYAGSDSDKTVRKIDSLELLLKSLED